MMLRRDHVVGRIEIDPADARTIDGEPGVRGIDADDLLDPAIQLALFQWREGLSADWQLLLEGGLASPPSPALAFRNVRSS